MKTNMSTIFFLLSVAVWMGLSSAQAEEELQNLRTDCSADFTPYCTCVDKSDGRYLTCYVSVSEDFDVIRSLLKSVFYPFNYITISFKMTTTLDIPQDILGGRRTANIYFDCTDSSIPLGKFATNVLGLSSYYTLTVGISHCDSKNFNFSFLSQISDLTLLLISFSSLITFNDMPYLAYLDVIDIQYTTDLESLFSLYQTPKLREVFIQNNQDLDDKKMDSILSSMTENLTITPTVNKLVFNNNALTKVPSKTFFFPALFYLDLSGNPIQKLTAGSLSTTYNNMATLYLENMQLTTIEPGAFDGYFAATQMHLGKNLMTSFPSSVFRDLLESMIGLIGHVDINENPIVDDCELAWLVRDNPSLLHKVINGKANETKFEDLNPADYSECP